eukprot:2025987-Amphidinium_carterae.2
MSKWSNVHKWRSRASRFGQRVYVPWKSLDGTKHTTERVANAHTQSYTVRWQGPGGTCRQLRTLTSVTYAGTAWN